jgi:transcriptional regulator with XRE-family HTH domain
MSPRLPRAPDAASLVGTLQRRGMTLTSIARALHAPASSVSRWRNGESAPSFRHGAALLDLVYRQMPTALSREGLQLVWHLTPVISCSLDASSTIVSDLNAQLLR